MQLNTSRGFQPIRSLRKALASGRMNRSPTMSMNDLTAKGRWEFQVYNTHCIYTYLTVIQSLWHHYSILSSLRLETNFSQYPSRPGIHSPTLQYIYHPWVSKQDGSNIITYDQYIHVRTLICKYTCRLNITATAKIRLCSVK